MKDSTTISSIKLSKELAKKVELMAKKEGVSRAEVVRRALEQYLKAVIDEKPGNAEELLELVKRRTGREVETYKTAKEIYKEAYELERL